MTASTADKSGRIDLIRLGGIRESGSRRPNGLSQLWITSIAVISPTVDVPHEQGISFVNSDT